MICAVVCLTLDKKEDGTTAVDGTELTAKEQKMYGLLAVLYGAFLAPLCWTIKSYYGREAIENNNEFPMYDLGIDQMIFQGIYLMVLFFIYLANNPFNWTFFWEGTLTGVFFLVATVIFTQAYETGPGGPIQVLLTTQVIYQSLINAIWLD